MGGAGRTRDGVRPGSPFDRRHRRRARRELGVPGGRHGRRGRPHPPCGRGVRRNGENGIAGRAGAGAGWACGGGGATVRGGTASAGRGQRDPPQDHLPSAHRTIRAPSGLHRRHRTMEEPQRGGEDQPGRLGAPRLHRRPGDEPAGAPRGVDRARAVGGILGARVPRRNRRPRLGQAVLRDGYPHDVRQDARPRGCPRRLDVRPVGAAPVGIGTTRR